MARINRYRAGPARERSRVGHTEHKLQRDHGNGIDPELGRRQDGARTRWRQRKQRLGDDICCVARQARAEPVDLASWSLIESSTSSRGEPRCSWNGYVPGMLDHSATRRGDALKGARVLVHETGTSLLQVAPARRLALRVARARGGQWVFVYHRIRRRESSRTKRWPM